MGSIDTTDGGSDDLVARGGDGGLDLGLVRGRDGGGGGHHLRVSVVLFSSPASDDDVGREGNEQRQKEDEAVGKPQIDGFAVMLDSRYRFGWNQKRKQSD